MIKTVIFWKDPNTKMMILIIKDLNNNDHNDVSQETK